MFETFLKIMLVISYFYLLSVFKRGRLEFFRFCLGTVGLFLIMVQFIDYLKFPLTYAFTEILGIVGSLTHLFEGYSRYGIFFINRGDTAMSLFMDLECSGLIEMMVFTSLIMFFPVYKGFHKFAMWLSGLILIFVFNIIRVFGIIILICSYGNEAYGFAHSIFGRLIFYVLVITLYFYVFTRGQLNNQNVGNFSYDGAKENVFADKKEEVKNGTNKQ